MQQVSVCDIQKNVLDSHMKIHGLPGQSKLNPGSNKLRCKQCDFEAEDLSSFLQHKLIHSSVQTPATNKLDREEEQVSPSSSSYTNEIDVMGSPTKHRRKPVKHFAVLGVPTPASNGQVWNNINLCTNREALVL